MEESYDAGFEPEESEYERPVMTEEERVKVEAFIKSVFERVMETFKKDMEDAENEDVPEEEKIVISVEEQKAIKEFLEKVFKKAIEIVQKEKEDNIGQGQSQPRGHQDDTEKDESPSKKIHISVSPSRSAELRDDDGREQSPNNKIHEEVTTETSNSIRRKISNVFKQGFHLPGQAPPKARPETKVENKHSIEDEEDSKSPYEGFVTYGGKNSRADHIIFVDPMKAPQSHVVSDNATFLRLLDNLLAFTDNFIAENTNGSPFILVYRCLDVSQSHSMKLKWMTKLYGALRDRYLGKLEKLIFYKPEMKLKVLVKICKPFMRRELSSKLVVVTDPVSLAREQCGWSQKGNCIPGNYNVECGLIRRPN